MDLILYFLVIELGNLRLSTATPLADVGWFVLGLLMLAGLSVLVLWWSRRGRRDPFV
ncbi:MAG: hypothetical protein H6666_14255 [Ardenticatenaceae bacterium]|nr:hypothetical protein [Anaerolineales bacterium]MCB8919075.1 hypothetical protein [Ardenticatenaceae bacterium]